MFDLGFVRSHFPALRDDWALFDNAGGSPPLAGVVERVGDYMRRWQVQLGASYEHSARASALVDAGQAAAARLAGVAPGEAVIGPSSSMNVAMLARAMRPMWQSGDAIVVTNLDHEANVGAWRELEREGLEVREWRFEPGTCELTLAGLEPLLDARTRLVCFTHCSNIVGTVHDAAAFVRRIHAAGALACVDGVAFAPHRQVDVAALGADVYFLSLYKVFGPHLALMVVRRPLLERLASRNHFFLGDNIGPYKLEPGNVVHELTASLPAIPEYLEALDAANHPTAPLAGRAAIARAFADIAAHERALAAPLLEFLRARREVHVLGHAGDDPERHVPTIAFTVAGRHASEIPAALDAERIAVRWGHFYAWRAIEALGLHPAGGVVRVSMAHYNSPAEVDRLVLALDRVL